VTLALNKTSRISIEGFAAALDEAESPLHIGQPFTVVY